MIKYLGSKRKLVNSLTEIATAIGTKTALDAFTGMMRVAQAFKKAGVLTSANDVASYSKVFADCYISTNKDTIDIDSVRKALAELLQAPGTNGYFT